MHETLSQAFDEYVDFDDVADRLRVMVAEVSSRGATVTLPARGQLRRRCPPRSATPLAMVLTEVLQNAVEHGFGDGGSGTITVDARAPGRAGCA